MAFTDVTQAEMDGVGFLCAIICRSILNLPYYLIQSSIGGGGGGGGGGGRRREKGNP